MIPKSTRALVVRESTDSSPLYHIVSLEERPLRELKPGELLVKIAAAAFNRRDLWIRLGRYPGISFGSVLGSDGAGTVLAAADPADPLLQKRVCLAPMRGWDSDPEAPESAFGILGGGARPDLGTFAEYVIVEREHVLAAPGHLDDVHLAAWPLAGLTAWRAAMVNAGVRAGQRVLITGAGGGVAAIAVQLCVAKGAAVYVTSGSQEKIARAVELGADGGVSYKSRDWPAQLEALLNGRHLDAVVDSGGGDIMVQVQSILKPGGRLVCYGMTAVPQITFNMRHVSKQHKLIGSTMGSRADLVVATRFVEEHGIMPVVSDVLDGLEAAEEGFERLKRGDQFGKIVIRVGGIAKL